MAAPPELAAAIRESAARLGIDPSDLATAISYETAGSFDPWKKGPTTQWGEHRGLIQWGEPQRQEYGVTANSTIPEQMSAVERYLTDAGVRPGHGLLDIYSAINAGRVGRYNASDANNGGAPGTVADKVADQMVGHRLRANALLGDNSTPPNATATVPQTIAALPPTAPTSEPMAMPPGATTVSDEPALDPGILAALQGISKQQGQQNEILRPVPPQQTINIPIPPGLAKARALALAMAHRPLGMT